MKRAKQSSKHSYSRNAKLRGHIHKATPRTRKGQYRSGTLALREIRHYQQASDLLVPKAPFGRVAKEVASDRMNESTTTNRGTLALQEAAEARLVDMFEDSNLCAIHCKRSRIAPEDVQLVQLILRKRA